jgi:hypothetical protein
MLTSPTSNRQPLRLHSLSLSGADLPDGLAWREDRQLWCQEQGLGCHSKK